MEPFGSIKIADTDKAFKPKRYETGIDAVFEAREFLGNADIEKVYIVSHGIPTFFDVSFDLAMKYPVLFKKHASIKVTPKTLYEFDPFVVQSYQYLHDEYKAVVKQFTFKLEEFLKHLVTNKYSPEKRD